MISYPLRANRAPDQRLKIGGCQCPDTGFPVTAFLNEWTGAITFEMDPAPDGFVDPGEIINATHAWCEEMATTVTSDVEANEYLISIGLNPGEIDIWPSKFDE